MFDPALCRLQAACDRNPAIDSNPYVTAVMYIYEKGAGQYQAVDPDPAGMESIRVVPRNQGKFYPT